MRAKHFAAKHGHAIAASGYTMIVLLIQKQFAPDFNLITVSKNAYIEAHTMAKREVLFARIVMTQLWDYTNPVQAF